MKSEGLMVTVTTDSSVNTLLKQHSNWQWMPRTQGFKEETPNQLTRFGQLQQSYTHFLLIDNYSMINVCRPRSAPLRKWSIGHDIMVRTACGGCGRHLGGPDGHWGLGEVGCGRLLLQDYLLKSQIEWRTQGRSRSTIKTRLNVIISLDRRLLISRLAHSFHIIHE